MNERHGTRVTPLCPPPTQYLLWKRQRTRRRQSIPRRVHAIHAKIQHSQHPDGLTEACTALPKGLKRSHISAAFCLRAQSTLPYPSALALCLRRPLRLHCLHHRAEAVRLRHRHLGQNL